MEKTWKPEPELLTSLDAGVSEILASQKPNGQFGTEPWISTDQNRLLPLAAAWSLKGSAHHHSEKVLDAIIRGGYALIDAQDEKGMWTFRKKDHSTWGQILMPWSYSRWIRAYHLAREGMPAEARARWEKGLLLGYEGISRTCLERLHNIPAHHAMGLYCAGIVFGREAWKAQAQAFLGRIAGVQSPEGWWAEHDGPVVAYNFVYSDALGVYYSMSQDPTGLAALDRAARYHAAYTYPDGSAVETVDGRNPYHAGVHLGNPGFSHTPAGRGYLAQQHALHIQTGKKFDPDYAASLLLYSGEGPFEETAGGRERHVHRMKDYAIIVRRRPWFISLSAFLVPPPENRWGQDRQNFVSIFHDRAGLVVGGGNTKLQPLWSAFTVGDTALMKHTPGDENPDFKPRPGLIHVPEKAELQASEESPGLALTYGQETCRVTAAPKGESELTLIYEATSRSGLPVEGHITLVPHLDRPVRFASGDEVRLGEAQIERAGSDGGWIEHAGWRLSLPRGARLVWPALPHNPYRKAGESTIEEARLVVALPFSSKVGRYELTLQVK
ncbi:MAG: hypothetical protein EXS64_18025 [Candidatus Latescibacteria bacterium]|nr:hypothetical protein [Candidatus Latescibacterota bacterium]